MKKVGFSTTTSQWPSCIGWKGKDEIFSTSLTLKKTNSAHCSQSTISVKFVIGEKCTNCTKVLETIFAAAVMIQDKL